MASATSRSTTPTAAPETGGGVATAEPATAEKAPAKSADPGLPTVLKIVDADVEIPEAEPTMEYHVGTLPSCPNQNVTLFGVTFPAYTGGASVGSQQRPGARVRLTARQIAGITEAVKSRVVRKWTTASGETFGAVLSKRTPGYKPQHGDEPLSRHVYCAQSPVEAIRTAEALPAAMS